MIFTISVSHSHINISPYEGDDKEVWSPPLTAYLNFEDAKAKVEEARTSIEEWSQWFETEINDMKVWYVYVTLNWSDGTKSFKTLRIDGIVPQV